MSDHYRWGPYKIDLHPPITKSDLENTVKDSLNEVMPTVMGEIEGMVAEHVGSLKEDLSNLGTAIEPAQNTQLTYEHGLRVGIAIGACLFIGLLAGLLIGKI